MMSQTENNLLLNLFYGTWKKDENFHTEALIHLVHHLLKHEPEAAVNILRVITGSALNLGTQDATSVCINTQITTARGFRPDIEIRTTECLIYVEVKVESRLRKGQLEEYRKALLESDFSKTCLALLTKYPVDLEKNDEKPDVTIRWYQIAEWIECELRQKTIQQPLSIYITEQILEFLRDKGMTVEQVGEELIYGIQSLRNLLNTVSKALDLMKLKSKIDSGEDDYGYCSGNPFKSNSDEYWVGIQYDRPQVLLFVTLNEIDESIYRQLKIGYLNEGQWIRELDLCSEEVQFFKLPKSRQLQYIEQFLVETLSAVKRIQS